MSCCGGRPCGGPGLVNVQGSSGSSRYPKPRAQALPDPALWKVAPPPAQPQFENSSEGQRCCGGSSEASPPWTYAGENLAALDFPLGGLGAGHVLLRGDGALGGFMVVNQVYQESAASHMPGCFFGASAEVDGQAQSFCLVTPKNYTTANVNLPEHNTAHVPASSIERLRALPGIKGLSVRGTFPIADVAYDIPGFPVTLTMEACTPIIPGETNDSSIPAAVFRFRATNSSDKPVKLRLLQSMQNFVGWDGNKDCSGGSTPFWGGNVNTPVSTGELLGLALSSQGISADSPSYGTVTVGAVAAAGVEASALTAAASEEELWAQFVAAEVGSAAAALSACPKCCGAGAPPSEPSASGTSWLGGVVQSVTVPAGGEAEVSFVLAWHFPNRGREASVGGAWDSILPAVLGNHYATIYRDATAAAQYVADNLGRLAGKTRLYRDTLFGTTVDPNILDCAAGRVSNASSPTMWRCADGTVLGSEGNGCCPLNCSHVYGYCTLLERLFPAWAKDMLESNFIKHFDSAKGVSMRFGEQGFAIDGSLASVIKVYLAVRQADSALAWLPQVWPNVKVMMQIAMNDFDGGDGVIRVPQQNTYDTAMREANTFIGSYYVTALRASAEMARLMGEPDLATIYAERAELSAANYDKVCWREDFGYYIADVTEATCQHSYGPGCFIDQLCAIGLSSAVGLGYMFDPAHETSARKQIAANNRVHCPPFKDMQKHFFPGDTGVRACTYPNGKLADGMTYDSIVSIGFTYPVIAGMLLDRNTRDAEELAADLRRRHDGRNHSPWNEPECGLQYSRAQAAWNLLDQACGMEYDATHASFAFDPRYNAEAFRCLFVAEGGWGEFRQTGPAGLSSGTLALQVLHGSVAVRSLKVASSATQAAVALDGEAVAASLSQGVVVLASGGIVREGSTLTVALSTPEDEAWLHVEEASVPVM